MPASYPVLYRIRYNTGYDKAIDILEKEFGMYIQSARCWAHARRPLFLLLQNEGLIEIYNKYLLPKGSVFTDFEANLDKYMKEPKDRALTRIFDS